MHKPIQIVDENGKFLELATGPREAKQKSQVRLISRVMLTNNQGMFLLQKRAEDMVAWPGAWDNSAAGHVDEGETPEQAAYRELAEEIGITNIDLSEQKQIYYTNPPDSDGSVNKTYSYVYTGVFNDDIAVLKLDPAEVSEVRWFSIDEIKQLIDITPSVVTDGIKMIFKEL